MNGVFVDTAGWMACADEGDPAHKPARGASTSAASAHSQSASSCISSRASTILSSGSAAQRRSCSRLAPSQVVRRQSISSLPASLIRDFVRSLPQLLDVREIFAPPSLTCVQFLSPALEQRVVGRVLY